MPRYRQRRQAEEAQLALELARRAAERYPVLAGRALRSPMAPTIDSIGASS